MRLDDIAAATWKYMISSVCNADEDRNMLERWRRRLLKAHELGGVIHLRVVVGALVCHTCVAERVAAPFRPPFAAVLRRIKFLILCIPLRILAWVRVPIINLPAKLLQHDLQIGAVEFLPYPHLVVDLAPRVRHAGGVEAAFHRLHGERNTSCRHLLISQEGGLPIFLELRNAELFGLVLRLAVAIIFRNTPLLEEGDVVCMDPVEKIRCRVLEYTERIAVFGFLCRREHIAGHGRSHRFAPKKSSPRKPLYDRALENQPCLHSARIASPAPRLFWIVAQSMSGRRSRVQFVQCLA